MIQLSRSFIACTLAFAATFGCGGDDTSNGSGSGPLSSGLPKTETVGSFSDADTQKLCQALAEYVANDPGIRSAECRLAGIGAAVGAAFLGTATDADLQSACSKTESACMSASLGADAGVTTTCHKPTGTCDVTVGEFEACLNDSLTALQSVISTLPSCSTLSASNFGQGSTAGAVQSPASCQVVNQKCPGGLASSGVPGSSTGA